MQPLCPEDRRMLIEAVRLMQDRDSPFASTLEQAIKTVKNYPKLPFTPENRAIREAFSEEREATHQRIVSWLIEYFDLKGQLVARAHERWELYKRTEPDVKLEDRWASAGEWLMNRFMSELAPNQLAAIVRIYPVDYLEEERPTQ